jgi:hypothetical protein
MKKFFPSVGQKRPRSEMVDLTCDTVDAPLKESALTSHPLSVDIAPSTATEATALSKNAFNTLMDRAKKASARPNSFEIFHIHLNPKGCSWYWSDKTGLCRVYITHRERVQTGFAHLPSPLQGLQRP